MQGQSKKTVVWIGVAGLVAVVLIVAVAIAHSHKKSATSASSTQSNSSSTPPNSNQSVHTTSVAIENFAFNPASVTVKVGTTVTWTNRDSSQHTVTGEGEGGPRSQPLKKNDSYTFTFSRPGTFKYVCTFHATMHGTVIVTQ